MSDSPSQLRAASVADYVFTIDGLAADALRVISFEGTEGISELYRFRVEVASDDMGMVPADQIGKACALEISGSAGKRWVNGMVLRFARLGWGRTVARYGIDVVPTHWQLSRRVQSRIFQASSCDDMTVTGIIKKVLETAGISEDYYRFATQATYKTREFVVQYRESDLDFISRLMEDEGIFYFFEHSDSGHKIVFGDSTTAHVATPNAAEFPYVEPGMGVTEANREYVYALRDHQEVSFGAASLRDFDYLHPSTPVKLTAQGDVFTNLQFIDYASGFEGEPSGGELDRTTTVSVERLAQVRLEEAACHRQMMQMWTVARGLLPGFKFTLTDHPVEAVNAEYLVTRQLVRGRQPLDGQVADENDPEFESEACAVLATVPFRPRRQTVRPLMRPQTAKVVGPSGEEIYVDKFGRVKIQFHWDLIGGADKDSSCWVRVNQGWAGGGYGVMFIPRIGQEVVVDFLEGDPDRPIITGRVFNQEHLPPYLPDNKTRSTIKTRSSPGGEGFNEIRFEDKKDEEQLFMHAQKDMDVRVLNDSKEWIGRDRHLIVKRDRIELIEGDDGFTVKGDRAGLIEGNECLTIKGDQLEQVDGAYHRKIAKDAFDKIEGESHVEVVKTHSLKVTDTASETYEADQNVKVGGDCGLKVTGKYSVKCDDKVSIDASEVHVKASGAIAIDGDTIHIKAGSTLVLEAGSQLSLKVGGNFVDISSSGVNVVGSAVGINSGGSAGSGGGCSAEAPAEATAPSSPQAPDAPPEALEADTDEAGQDVEPAPDPSEMPALSPMAVVLTTAAESGAVVCEPCEAAEQEEEEAGGGGDGAGGGGSDGGGGAGGPAGDGGPASAVRGSAAAPGAPAAPSAPSMPGGSSYQDAGGVLSGAGR